MMSFLFCFFPNHSGNGDDLLLEAPVTHMLLFGSM